MAQPTTFTQLLDTTYNTNSRIIRTPVTLSRREAMPREYILPWTAWEWAVTATANSLILTNDPQRERHITAIPDSVAREDVARFQLLIRNMPRGTR